MNWIPCRDGQRRAEIRVSHRLTRDDMIQALAIFGLERQQRQSDDSFPPLPKALALEGIRWTLKTYPDRLYTWHEDLVDQQDIDELRTWATRQVMRLAP